MDRGAEYYARFLAGDDDAFADLIREYKNPLMLFINGIVGNIYTAEDLTEDTFVRIAVRKPRFREGKASFKTWLFTIARNVTYTAIRKRQRIQEVQEDVAAMKADTRSIEEEYLRKEEYIELHDAMDSLPPDYRQVLYLIFFEEMSCDDVARTMKKRSAQVSGLLRRAKEALKQILTEKGISREGL